MLIPKVLSIYFNGKALALASKSPWTSDKTNSLNSPILIALTVNLNPLPVSSVPIVAVNTSPTV